MGKLTGLIKLTGSLDDLSFYKSRQCPGKIVVRQKGGFDGKLIKAHPNHVRTRENISEFGSCAKAGKLFRQALRSYLTPMAIPYVQNKVQQLFMAVKDFDAVNARGQRTVGEGLSTPEGAALFSGYEFDSNHEVSTLLAVPYTLSLTEGVVHLPEFDSRLVLFPESATHAEVSFILLRMDFDGLKAGVESQFVLIPKGVVVESQMITTALPDGDGMLIGLLHIAFKEEVNGKLYPLQGGGLRIVGVGGFI